MLNVVICLNCLLKVQIWNLNKILVYYDHSKTPPINKPYSIIKKMSLSCPRCMKLAFLVHSFKSADIT